MGLDSPVITTSRFKSHAGLPNWDGPFWPV